VSKGNNHKAKKKLREWRCAICKAKIKITRRNGRHNFSHIRQNGKVITVCLNCRMDNKTQYREGA
jgi:hypothetical protein